MLGVLRDGLDRYRELALGGVFLAMGSWELGEIWMLETTGPGWSVAIVLVHAIQVTIILGASYLGLRAWREKTERERALARLVTQVSLAQEEERRRVAYDIHDGLAQLIVSAKQHLDTCADLLAGGEARARDELRTGLDRLNRAVSETRRILMALRPPALDAAGLARAVNDVLREAAEEGGWSIRFDSDIGPAPLPEAAETAAFRIAQEALANCLRHSGTSAVEVGLARRDGCLVLDVRDFGAGFGSTPDPNARGLGLQSMRERARLLGGDVSIEATPGRGTRVTARLTIRHD